MEFYPMNAAVASPSFVTFKRPDGQLHVGEPVAACMRRVAADRAIFAQLGQIRSFRPQTVPDSVSLAQWQTPIRDQGDRGTCYAFACIAAMEALYKRTFGLTLDLSEQYAIQIGKIGELYPTYLTDTIQHESNTTYWDGQGDSGFLNVLCRCAIPLESDAPYLTHSQLERIRQSLALPAMDDFNTITQETIDTFEFCDANVPISSRSRAIYRGTSYTPINLGISDVENAIASNHEVVVDISTAFSLDANGVWQWNQNDPNQTADHCVLIVGYDQNSKVFTFKNSWGGRALTA